MLKHVLLKHYRGAATQAQTWVRYGGPDAAPVTTDGTLPETSDLVAGWYMVDVESRERAVEIAAYISSEPDRPAAFLGPGAVGDVYPAVTVSRQHLGGRAGR
jgi:hypothetical protein